MKKVTVAGVALILMTSTSALAQSAKFDDKIAKAAAEKIADIRGSINYDKAPDMVTKENLAIKPINTSFLPKNTESKENTLPPMTSLIQDLDLTVAGSINNQQPKIAEKIIWDKFDRYGNPIK